MGKSNGLTLIELLVVIAIVVILAAIAVPAYFHMTASNRITGAVNAFAATLALARSEAITRGEQVVVCPSANGATCDSGDWQEGWLAFVDKDSSGTFGSGDTLIRVHGPIGSGVSMTGASSGAVKPYIGFNRMGFAQPTFAGTTDTSLNVIACPSDKRAANARAVVLALSGDVTTAARQPDGSMFSCP